MKPKICKACKKQFIPDKPMQSVCDWKCAGDHANNLKVKRLVEKAKKERKEYKDAKLKVKSHASWKEDAQKAFNAYIRARDGKYCISCGTTNPNIQFCAGHYRTRKAASQLRFNEDNTNTQCNNYCNSKLSGNIGAYRIALISKIGIKRVESLENNHETHTYTIDELKSIIQEYKHKLKLINT